MKKQRNEKPIDEELLMRMMAGEAAGTGEPGTGKGETAVPVEKAQEGTSPPVTASRSMCAVSTTSASPKFR